MNNTNNSKNNHKNNHNNLSIFIIFNNNNYIFIFN